MDSKIKNKERSSDNTQSVQAVPQSNSLKTKVPFFLLMLLLFCIVYYFGVQAGQRRENVNEFLPTYSESQTIPTQGGMPLSECNNKNGQFTIDPANDKTLCTLTLSLPDYSLKGYVINYPRKWTVRIAGAEGINLLFNEGVKKGEDSELFIQITSTKLSLEQSNEATYGFEMSEAQQLVKSNEIIVDKSIITIGNKQVLSLKTKSDNETIQRYFLQEKGKKQETGLYMFKAVSEDKKMIENVKNIISSMYFLD